MRLFSTLGLTATLLALLRTWPAHAGTVRAEDYSSFWIWGGVRSQPALSRAESLYVLQGEVTERNGRHRAGPVLVPQGMTVARFWKSRVWLVYRANTLRWTPHIILAVILRLRQWRLSGNPVAGLQIDFDVGTRYLREYVVFLRQLRAQLPADYQLGITGLLDWSANGDIETINQLGDVVDEVIVQTYQGRETIPNYNDYLPALRRLSIPFRIGLIQNGNWQAPEDLESNPWFQGYVVFLRNQVSTGQAEEVAPGGKC